MIANLEFDEELEDVEVQERLEEETHIQNPLKARNVIASFFKDREMFCGGKILDKFLLNERNISLVLNTNIEVGVQRAYQALSEANHFPPCVDMQLVPDDVRLVMSVLKQCAKSHIPKDNAAGILLLYLEFCEGVSVLG